MRPRRCGDPRRRASGTRDGGQATVELALVLPLVLTVLLVVVQVGLVVHQQVLVSHAAREGARAAAVGGDAATVRSAALGAADLDPDRAEVEVRHRGAGLVEVTVRWRLVGAMPLVGGFVDGHLVAASVVMRAEDG